MTSDMFCRLKNINDFKKDFLYKKYQNKKYSFESWEKILIEEKIFI